MEGVRIDALAAALAATRAHAVPAMKDGATVFLTVGQILDLVIGAAPGGLDTLDELAAALAAKANASDVTAALALKQDKAGMTFGQCRLTLSGGNLLLSRHAGRSLTINGEREEIPSAGVSLAPSGFTAGSNYLIAAYMNSGVMTLERLDMATYSYAIDAATGMPIKRTTAGGALDPTRTIVGMAGAIAGPAFADTPAQRLVISYFNRRTIGAQKSFSTDRTTGSASYVEIDPEIRTEFLIWDDEAIQTSLTATVNNGTGGRGTVTAIAFDGTTPDVAEGYFVSGSASYDGVIGLTLAKSGLTAGRHYATALGKTDGSGTSKWRGTSAAFGKTVLSVMTRG